MRWLFVNVIFFIWKAYSRLVGFGLRQIYKPDKSIMSMYYLMTPMTIKFCRYGRQYNALVEIYVIRCLLIGAFNDGIVGYLNAFSPMSIVNVPGLFRIRISRRTVVDVKEVSMYAFIKRALTIIAEYRLTLDTNDRDNKIESSVREIIISFINLGVANYKYEKFRSMLREDNFALNSFGDGHIKLSTDNGHCLVTFKPKEKYGYC